MSIKKIFIILIAGFAIAATTYNNDKMFEISKNLEIFVNVYRELNTNFVDDLDPNVMMKTAIDAMTHNLDPYTNYVTESQIESYWINEDEKYQGIGAKTDLINGKFTIIEPFENGPTQKAGIIAGDIILSIDGVNIANKSKEEINAILRGLPGTNLSLSVERLGQKTPLQKSLVRGEVNITNVPYSGYVEDNVGYISLTVFTQNAAANIAKAIKDLKSKNANLSGIILDLRQNGGGLLHEAVNICNLFIPTGETVVTTKGKIKEKDQSYKTTAPPLDLDIPLAVLIDKRSASASEIVSGVIQDMDRGVLLGQRSFGKGLVQNSREVGYNARLKITISKYYIPSGRCIQGVEYENGEPKDIPDHLRTKFKTNNGRTVLDGGGIAPDIKLEPRKVHPLTQALLDKYVIFNYVNQYIKGKDSIAAVGTYQYSDYQDFMDFVNKNGFTYESEAQKHLTTLKKEIESSQSFSPLTSDINKLDEKLNALKAKEFETAREQIIDEIEKEIIGRFYFQKGKVQQTLADDSEVKEAIKILKDTNKYNTILGRKR